MDIRKKLTRIIHKLLLSNGAAQNNGESPIIAVYLFGSFAKNSARRQSDIDLAFVVDEKYYREDPFRSLQKAELLSLEISQKINKSIDVVVLNSASLSFAYHVIRNGVCLYERDTIDRILYEVAIQNKYEDFVPFVRELREIKRRRLLGSKRCARVSLRSNPSPPPLNQKGGYF